MHIENGCVVYLDFTLADGSGNRIDSSPEGEPLAYLHGGDGILPALAAELQGKEAGDSFDVTMPPEQAYGEHDYNAVARVPRSQVPAEVKLEVGMRVAGSNGSQSPSIVTEITPEYISLDANHPLAGLTLRFQGSVVEVRKATEEELAGDDSAV